MKITRKQLEALIIQEITRRSMDDPRGNLDRTRDITVSRTGGPRPAGHPFYDYNPQDFPGRYDAEEVERFPNTAASKDEMLHADIVSSVYDAIADTALLNAGKDRENIVLTGIDNELESREMEGEEVDMTQIDLKSIFRDVMIDLAAVEKSKGMTESKQEGKMKITRSQIIQLIKEELGRLNESDLPEGYRDPLKNVGEDYSDMKFEDIRKLFKNAHALDMLMTPQLYDGIKREPKALGRFLVLKRSDHADLDTEAFKQLQKDKGKEKRFPKVKTFSFVKDGEKYYIVLETRL